AFGLATSILRRHATTHVFFSAQHNVEVQLFPNFAVNVLRMPKSPQTSEEIAQSLHNSSFSWLRESCAPPATSVPSSTLPGVIAYGPRGSAYRSELDGCCPMCSIHPGSNPVLRCGKGPGRECPLQQSACPPRVAGSAARF